MTLRLKDAEIENLHEYPAHMVASLRHALRNGATAEPDPKRRNFYEVRVNGHCFYIDVLPEGHKVILLGAWPNGIDDKSLKL